MTTTVGQLPAATSIAATDLIPVEQGGILKRATPNLLPFTPSGTGAVTTRTVQDALRAMVRSGDFSSSANFRTAVKTLTESIGIASLETAQATELTAVILHTHRVVTAGAAPYEVQHQSFNNTGAGAGTINQLVADGYNPGRHTGLPVVAGKPSWYEGQESNYFDDGGDNTTGVERYWSYWSADGTTVQLLRPIYTRVRSANNTDSSCTTIFDIGTDGTGALYVKAGTTTLLQITGSLTNIYKPTTIVDTTDATNSSTASLIAKGGLWVVKKLEVEARARLAWVNAYNTITPDASNDRMVLGVITTSVPTNSAGAYIGWASGVAGTLSGDLLIMPRSSVGGSIRLYTGTTTPSERFTIDATGNVGIGIATSSTTILNLPAGTTAISTLRIPHGSAPTSPVNGDIWTTTAGLFVRVNGVTVGPLT